MSISRPKTIGVAGCGAMGLPMALALQSAGFNTVGLDVRPAKEFGDFAAKMAPSASQFAQNCDVVICVVRDEQQVLDLCFEKQAIFCGTTIPDTFVLSSTVTPGFVHELREKLPADVNLIDAPMSGAPLAAINKTLTFMVGGQEETVTGLTPLFEAMGNKTHFLGSLGSGMTTKVLNNFVAATTVVAVRNVLLQADKLGMDKEKLLEVISQSSGQTWFGSNCLKIDWANEGYDAANTIGILEKDVNAFINALPAGPDPLHKAIITALQTLPPASG